MAGPDIFCTAVREQFAFLVSEYDFVAKESFNEGWGAASVTFDAPRLSIEVFRNYKDGFGILFLVKADTFWIRPASSRYYHFEDLLWMLAPKELYEAPGDAAEANTKVSLSLILRYWAELLKKYATALLRGDLGLCEDMLITAACQMKSTTPLDDYVKAFRGDISVLPAHERAPVESAFASEDPLRIWLALEALLASRRLLTERFLQTMSEFRGQYVHGVSA